jgi:hypothetical protein
MGLQPQLVVGLMLLLQTSPVSPGVESSVRVDVLGEKHPSREPISIRVTNLSKAAISLAFPMSTLKGRQDRIVNNLPLVLEQHVGNDWKPHNAGVGTGLREGQSSILKPGDSLELSLGVVEPGEYRIRISFSTVTSANLAGHRFTIVYSDLFAVVDGK